jgi:tetratricopeptide (TPR) repeat protein
MKRDTRFLYSLWILTLVAIPACGRGGVDNPTSNKPSPGPSVAPQGEVVARDALSESDCRTYAQSVLDAIKEGRLAELNALVDWDTLFKTMATGWDIPDKVHQGMLRGLRAGLDGELGFTGQLIRNSKIGGSYRFLRTRESHGRQVILIRMIQPNGGVAYFELVPRRLPDGRVRAADIYVYATGEFLSETFRQGMLPMIAEQSRTFIDKLLTGEKDYIHDFPNLERAAALLNQGKAQEALAIYKEMRPETRKQKLALLGRLRAAQAVDFQEYAAVLADFEKFHPDDPCLELILIDALALRKDFPGAIRAVDQLEKSVGGDPYLDVLRSGLRRTQGDLEGSRQFARKAVEREPSLLQGYWALVDGSLKSGKHEETLEYLKEIDRNFIMTFNNMNELPDYAGFVKSPSYAKWLDYLKTKKPAATKNGPQENIAAPGQVKKGSP